MRQMATGSVDFILTDPVCLPIQSSSGQTIRNDDNTSWIRPAFREMQRVVKNPGLCLTFYGWGRADVFLDCWQLQDSWPVGHLIFPKR
ncbi:MULTISPECIES: hypothetical protein [unclassified Bradyrhizobium]|uniref:hypothetical protein n=1 Tax=unclassified Bradyrhizobium TaxID=2631580 RepID=UPI001CD491BF|nr:MULTISPECIES: hypothetical protein [unclassified Bradyrhizobium]MCA1386060.1 hypothetical protein [Bradyrhizobium sp. BRP05]MCA1393858.1 hypothetical protein [Bradyrhizobium sp. IC3123]MCA1423502.1 hypothetical protein [Bradyrhizobium sp. BRP23]MCA1430604.1 hypothetical protein [Bradyrhizobium sp. NBAIM16]MCA1480115.1 hypothetical protein [Bradyrhizobium sp. NBAIM08]